MTRYLILSKPENNLSPNQDSLQLIDPAEITSIQINRANKETIQLSKSGSDWYLTDPVPAPANRFRISSIFKLLREHVYTQFKVTQPELSKYGLDQAIVTLSLDDNIIYFGDINPLEQGRFIQHGETVFVIEDNLFHQLIQPAEFFISTLMLTNADAIIRIQCGEMILQKDNGHWQQTAGDISMSNDKIFNMNKAWLNLEANRVTKPTTRNTLGKIFLSFNEGPMMDIELKKAESELIMSLNNVDLDYWFLPKTFENLGIPITGC
ncbi:MAG: hypothetical protein ACI9XC_001898 [Gammaproteobacteria bacterium]|jgi:hypothetical protein